MKVPPGNVLTPLIFEMLGLVKIVFEEERNRDQNSPLLDLRPSFLIVPKKERVGVGSTIHGESGMVGSR
jgi:hypothetical protein